MSYLYGDSTASGLNRDYIRFLQDFLTFASELLQGESRVADAKIKVTQINTMGNVERERLASLKKMIQETLKNAAKLTPDQTPSSEATKFIWKSTEQALKQAEGQLSKGLAISKKDCSDVVMLERTQHLSIFEKFLKEHHLPDSSHYIDLRFDEYENKYSARQNSRSESGFDCIFTIIIEDFPLFHEALMVKRFIEEIDIHAPETSGLVRKSTKIRSQSLDNKYLVSLTTTEHSIKYSLRDQPTKDESGFDIEVLREGNRVKIARVAKGSEGPIEFEATLEDSPSLARLAHHFEEATKELHAGRGKLVDARLDGHQIKGMDDPKLVVERIIERISPIVRAIGERSLSPDELVLKKVLEDNKREEIYVSKKDLLETIQPVPAELQHIFKPLGIGVMPEHQRSRRMSLASAQPQTIVVPTPPSALSMDDETIVDDMLERISTEDIVIDEATMPPEDNPVAQSISGKIDVDSDDSLDDALNKLQAEE